MTAIQRQKGQAGLPTPESTKSFWHSEPAETLLGHRTTDNLPSSADVVVVGSGITGTFAAQELVQGGKTVLLLEAREACWGATGRVSFWLFIITDWHLILISLLQNF
jgi:hypothetical protein